MAPILLKVSRRRRFLRVLLTVSALLAIAVLVRAIVRRWPDARVQLVAADPAQGFHSPYYVFVPDAVRVRRPPGPVRLLVIPNNTGGGGHDDFDVHRQDVLQNIRHFRARAEELGVVVLMPVFPRSRTDWQVYTHALDRDVFTTSVPAYKRLDQQLIAMIDHARARLQMGTDERVLMQGFSASGMFVSRFTLLHPDRVRAAVVGAPGGWPMAPTATLRYPMGTSDVAALTGAPFDAERARAVPIWFHLGALDTNDSVPFEDGYDPEDARVVMNELGKTPVERWPVAERMFREAGFTNARFTLHPGIGHEIPAEVEREIRAFFATH